MAGTLKKKTSDLRMEETTAENSKLLSAISDNMVMEVEENQHSDNEKKQNDMKLVNFRMNKEIYEEYKNFFMTQGYSFSKITKMAIDYLYSEIMSGHLELRESGIRETVSNQMRNMKR